MREKFIKQLDIVLKLLSRYGEGQPDDRIKQLPDWWTPHTDGLEGVAEDERSAAARERVRREVFAHIHFQRHPLRAVWNNYRQYAAVVTIVLIVGSAAWLFPDYVKSIFHPAYAEARESWQTEESGRMTVTLSDGSVVRINAGSRLEMNESVFNKDKREVWLSGEAFFEITENPEKPFIVHTGDVQTTVRGTSFNVKAYEQLEATVVSVREGKVDVSAGDQSFGTLTANKQLSYDKMNGEARTSDADWRGAAGWIDGQMVLNRAGANELALRIKQQFGVEVVIENDAMAGEQVSGVFAPESTLEEVFQTISAVHQIRYQINEKKVIITP